MSRVQDFQVARGRGMRAALFLVATVLALSVEAANDIIVTTDFYDVGGETVQEIRSDLDRKRTRGWDGYTEWQVEWQFRSASSGSECRVTDVTTRVAVNYSLPRWRAPAAAGGDTRERWARYERALRAHEDGHRNIGVRVASEIDNTLRAMRAGDCRELDALANAAAYRLLDHARQREREYDQSTNYGATQGARFP